MNINNTGALSLLPNPGSISLDGSTINIPIANGGSIKLTGTISTSGGSGEVTGAGGTITGVTGAGGTITGGNINISVGGLVNLGSGGSISGGSIITLGG
jgi:hypothetical protein